MCDAGTADNATAVDQRNAGELSSVCTAQKGTPELSEWIEMRQPAQSEPVKAWQWGEFRHAAQVCTCILCAAQRAGSQAGRAVIVIIAIAIRIQPRSPLRTKV